VIGFGEMAHCQLLARKVVKSAEAKSGAVETADREYVYSRPQSYK